MSDGQLFDAGRKAKWAGSRALVVREPGCPECGGFLVTSTSAQPALFIHGDYGATQQTTWRICVNSDCRWSFVAAIDEVRPDR